MTLIPPLFYFLTATEASRPVDSTSGKGDKRTDTARDGWAVGDSDEMGLGGSCATVKDRFTREVVDEEGSGTLENFRADGS